MATITTATAVNTFVTNLLGGAATTADAANALTEAAKSDTNFSRIANNVVAIGDTLNVGGSNLQMLQQFAQNSTKAGALAGGISGAGAYLGLWTNVYAMSQQVASEGGIDNVKNSDILSILGGGAAVVAAFGAAPVVLGVAAAGLTITAIATAKNSGTLSQDIAALKTVVQSYYSTLTSATDRTAFSNALTNSIQSIYNGAMAVPQINSNGEITGYSLQVPTSVVNNSPNTTYLFGNGVTYTQGSTPGDCSITSGSGVAQQGRWILPSSSSSSQSVTLCTYKDGSYTYEDDSTGGEKIQLVNINGTAENWTASIKNGATGFVTENGSNGQLSVVGTNVDVSATGSGNKITCGANDIVTEIGNNNTLTLGTGGTATVKGTGETVNTSSSTVKFGQGSTGNVNGTSDAIDAASGVTVTGSGANMVFNSDPNATGVTFGVASTNAQVNGSYLNAYFSKGAYGNVIGNYNNVGALANVTASVFGNDNKITCSATDLSDTFGIHGNDNVAYTSNCKDYVGTDSTCNINGAGNIVGVSSNSTVSVYGDGEKITCSANDTIGINNDSGQADSVNTTGATGVNVYESENAQATIAGTCNIGLLSGAEADIQSSGCDVTASGDGIRVNNLNNGNLVLLDNTSCTLNGSGNAVTLNDHDTLLGTESGGTLAVCGSDDSAVINGGSVTFASNVSNEHITGSGDTFAYSPGDLGLTYDNAPIDTAPSPNLTPTPIPDPVYIAPDPWDEFNYSGGSFYGYYGFAGSQSTVASAMGSNIGAIAQYDIDHGDVQGAAVAEQGLKQTRSAAASGANSVLTGSKWNQQVVTWSLADQGGQFSGKMDAAEEAAVQQAFDTWSQASGLTFQEVSDSTSSNIRVGLSAFDTANTGIVGYTTLQASAGQIQSSVVRVEDPTQDALVAGAGDQSTYAGTDATFEQALFHEIGHALGLADNADANSIESYYLGNANRTLDSNDTSAIQSLYSPASGYGSRISTTADQLTQAMASFAPTSAAQIAAFVSCQPTQRISLATAH